MLHLLVNRHVRYIMASSVMDVIKSLWVFVINVWIVLVRQMIRVIRYSLIHVLDYDLCTACMESGALEQHNPFHEFFDIDIPGRVYVHTLLGSDRGRNRQQVPSTDHPQGIRQRPSVTPVDPPVRHSATCNLCDSGIVGERYVSPYLRCRST